MNPTITENKTYAGWNHGKFPPISLRVACKDYYNTQAGGRAGSPRVSGQWFNRVEKNCVTNESYTKTPPNRLDPVRIVEASWGMLRGF
jgi:hypothetical protein